MSFEERFAAMGRALDGLTASMRRGASRSRVSVDVGSIREAVSRGVSRAYERSKDAVSEQGSRAFSRENRTKYGVAALVIISVVLTAVVTWNFAGGGGGGMSPEELSSIRAAAEARDSARVPVAGAPTIIRAGNRPAR